MTKASNEKCFRTLIMMALAMMIAFVTPTSVIAQNSTRSQANDGKRIITGIVYDDEGAILPGANVYVKGNAQQGTVTNNDGKFSLSVPADAKTVIISCVGFKAKEIALGRSTNIRTSLAADTEIQEVVVTGIVTKKKDTFTGSSATFSQEDLKSIGVQNPLQSLKALDPAFNMLDNNLYGSDPNHMPNIEIRGKSSMLGMRDELSEDPNQPLFILDGFESSLQAIYNLDINRIESMTILKDAASTAIYGSKAANGVVVVETVKPKAGQLRLSYNGSMDISAPDLTSYNLMNSKEKLEFEKLAGKYDGNGSGDAIIALDNFYQERMAAVASGVDTYWLSEPLRTGINHRHNVYLDGGSNGFMFGIGLTYNGVQGVMKKSDREVYGGNLDLTYRVNKLLFTNKFTAQVTDYNDPIVSFSQYAQANPYFKKYNDEGIVEKFLANNNYEPRIGNPIYNDQLNSRDHTQQLTLSNFFSAEYNPITELRLRARVGITHTTSEKDKFTSPDDTRFESYDVLKRGSYNYSNNKSTRYEGEFTAIFAKLINDMHRVNLALGGNISETKTSLQGYAAQGFPSGNFTYPSYSNGYQDGGRPQYNESVSRSASAYFTGGYSLMDRYLLDASVRLSGASVFGSNRNTIGTWSLGLGWNLHNEKFIKDNVSAINYLKIRASIGNPGNMNYDSAMSLTTYSYAMSAYNYFGLGSVLGTLGNANLKWQTTLDKNVGIDISLLNNRWNITADYYHKNTDPLLIAVGLPSSSGVPGLTYNTNLGKQISQGFTATVQYYILRDLQKRITWSVRANVRMEKVELDGIGNSLESLNSYGQSRTLTRYYDGADPDALWAVRSAGIDPATGREMFIKKDGTYSFDFTYDDEVIVGNSRPDMEGIVGTNFGYKGLTVGATFRYRCGGQSFNSAVYNKVENITASALSYNQDKRALYDRWQKPGDIAQFKNIATSANTPMSSRFVQDDNTFSLESLSVGYEFDPTFVKTKLGLNGLRLNAYMNDVFRISSIKEERGTSYPFSRSVTFALSLTL